MRIIAGKWRSRSISRPATDKTRPFPDRVKEALFSMLGERFDTPGTLPAIRVADVFSGGGTLGLEALSRGAASCYFFEKGREALSALRGNIEALDAAAESKVVTGDAWQRAIKAHDSQPFDLILLDPPYAMSADTSTSGPLFGFLKNLAVVNGKPECIILHHEHQHEYNWEDELHWQIIERRRFGTNGICIFEYE